MATKAKRRIYSFDFEAEGAHVALVSKDQGGAANGVPLLIAKSTKNLPEVSDYVKVQKALEQITVTLSMEEFLRKFFDMWSDDAEMLTKLLGFETEYENYEASAETAGSDGYYSHSKWLEDRLSKFTIMKSLHEGSAESISADDFIEILSLQEKVEKALNEQNQNGDTQVDKIQVEKAQYEQLEKNANEKEVAVAKAAQLEADLVALQEEISVMKAAKEAEALEVVKAAIKDLVAEDKLESVAKALHAMDKDAAEAVIASMTATKTTLEKSALFEEVSHGEEIDVEKAAKDAKAKARQDHLAKDAEQAIV